MTDDAQKINGYSIRANSADMSHIAQEVALIKKYGRVGGNKDWLWVCGLI
jgi:hypothetical protein